MHGNEEHLSAANYTRFCVVIAIFFIVGLSSQIVGLLALLRVENRTKKLAPYLTNMIICNIIVIASFPVTFTSALNHDFVLNGIGCQVVGFISGVASIAGLITLVCSVGKIYYTVTAQQTNRIVVQDVPRWQSTSWVLAGVWIYSSLLVFPPLVGWSEITDTAGHTVCAPKWLATSTAEIFYIIYLEVTAFMVPITVSCVYFYKIYTYFASLNMVKMDGYRKSLLEMSKNISIMVAVMIAAFVVSWSPYAICGLISAFGGSRLYDSRTSFIPNLFAKFSFVYNPIIFLVINRRFRGSILRVLHLHRGADEHLPETSNLAIEIPPQRDSQFILEPRPPMGIPDVQLLPQVYIPEVRNKKGRVWFFDDQNTVKEFHPEQCSDSS